MKTAFLFPGQGAQVVGMGADIGAAFTQAADIFKKANDILGFDLSDICFNGPAERLNSTEISQPAIFTVSAAILEVLKAVPGTAKIRPDVTAGLSLGEYTALYAAGVIDFESALLLCHQRGKAMQKAADGADGGMLSIIGLDDEKVHQFCARAAQGDVLAAVNFNCPGQIVVSGTTAACRRAEQLAVEYGALKAVPLQVAGPFHTDFMAPAAEQLSIALAKCPIRDPGDIRVIANIDGHYYTSAADIAHSLVKQLTNPVLWHKCMQTLLDDGVEVFYEVGPGRVLTSLMKRISRKTQVINVSTLDALNALLNP